MPKLAGNPAHFLLDRPNLRYGPVWDLCRGLLQLNEVVQDQGPLPNWRLRGNIYAPGPGEASWGMEDLLERMREAILWEWDLEAAWRWARTIVAYLVTKANHWEMELAGYYVATFLRYLGLLSLTEGRADYCLAVLVAGKQTGGERGEF